LLDLLKRMFKRKVTTKTTRTTTTTTRTSMKVTGCYSGELNATFISGHLLCIQFSKRIKSDQIVD
jgi:hypothetical protein